MRFPNGDYFRDSSDNRIAHIPLGQNFSGANAEACVSHARHTGGIVAGCPGDGTMIGVDGVVAGELGDVDATYGL